ncbi:hypothetical protein [Variovorax sp. 770b2]|uniref:hypothetical protein n=1 Tax=Variovorax sp. 770b2 TaxID=1566271 RepID=UPI001160D6EE|nr:hypothetical protein [Variovorax sp. 770b2]
MRLLIDSIGVKLVAAAVHQTSARNVSRAIRCEAQKIGIWVLHAARIKANQDWRHIPSSNVFG